MNWTRAFALCALLVSSALAAQPALGGQKPPKVDRIVLIVMENQEESNILTASPAGSKTPLLRQLAQGQRIATNYYGVTHPSEPNYISMIGGDHFGIQSDHPSCFTTTLKLHCNSSDAPNLIDSLEEKHIPWTALMQSMPGPGYLRSAYFFTSIYAEKHNPLVFFADIAHNPQRMAHIKPIGAPDTVRPYFADAATAPRFVLLIPDLCHDMHGAPSCEDKDDLYKASDEYVTSVIKNIVQSPAFTENSAIIVTWDEGSTDLACCGLSKGGGRVAAIVIKKHAVAFRSAVSYNHYSLLNTIETVWSLKRVGRTNDRNPNGTFRFAPMLDLLDH
ncbi:MAG: alkaline phosphatase family protein [Vulcanimicrobiaceae bacterium]